MKASDLTLTSATLASIAILAVGCSGIDGLPDSPVPPSDSDASVSDAATGTETGPSIDTGGADAAVDSGEAGDVSVLDAADATTAVDASADATVDAAPCVPEDDVAFCTRLGKNCGLVNATDNCGARRTVASCGVCTSYYDSCGGGGVPSRCGCMPESDWAFCSRLGLSCGPGAGTDNCGNSRAVGSCGTNCPADAGTRDAGPIDGGSVDASTVQRWTFTTCGAVGATGPTQAQCDAAYAGTNLSAAITLSSGIQRWRVPSSGRFRVIAMGAQGGNAGGRGALVQGEFTFSNADVLSIAVGQRGLFACGDGGIASLADATPGGGGGSFVARPQTTPLVVAGGGGGAAGLFRCACDPHGNAFSRAGNNGCWHAAQSEPCWTPVPNEGTCAGSGAAGFNSCTGNTGIAARGFLDGATGGRAGACNAGGFGGGAGGGVRSTDPNTGWVLWGAGGGGGYGGGWEGGLMNGNMSSVYPRNSVPQTAGSGGGGGSFASGDNVFAFSGFREGDGLVTVEMIP
jgi:hypothetical protein